MLSVHNSTVFVLPASCGRQLLLFGAGLTERSAGRGTCAATTHWLDVSCSACSQETTTFYDITFLMSHNNIKKLLLFQPFVVVLQTFGDKSLSYLSYLLWFLVLTVVYISDSFISLAIPCESIPLGMFHVSSIG